MGVDKCSIALYALSRTPSRSRRLRAGQSCTNGPRSRLSFEKASIGLVYTRLNPVRNSSTVGEHIDGCTCGEENGVVAVEYYS